LKNTTIPGAAIALIHNGEVVWSQGFGLADEASLTPVTQDTLFQVASISKSLAAWGVLRLVEDGQIDLDTPALDYLTQEHFPQAFSEPVAEGKPAVNLSEVTVRRLLSHTSGLALWNYPGAPAAGEHPALDDLLSGIGAPRGVQITQPPGASYRYTNGGYLLLQLILEDVTGEKFASYMDRQVFQPLGMAHSTFEWLPGSSPAAATGYTTSGKPVDRHWYPEAAGGLYSTAADLAAWLAAGMPGPNGEPAGRGILQPQTLEEMMTPTAVTKGSADGLGYAVETLPDGTRMVLYTGDVLGWRGQYVALPDKRAGIIVLTNSNTSRYFIANTICSWALWAAGTQPSVCSVYRAVLVGIPVIAAVLLAIVYSCVRLMRQIQTGKRAFPSSSASAQPKRDHLAAVRYRGLVAVRFPRLATALPPDPLGLAGFDPVVHRLSGEER
jgi:CubicO group peptidase (beta-lactamase class C family)